MIIRIAKVCADGNKLYFQKDRLFPVDRQAVRLADEIY